MRADGIPVHKFEQVRGVDPSNTVRQSSQLNKYVHFRACLHSFVFPQLNFGMNEFVKMIQSQENPLGGAAAEDGIV